jgi:alpha-1,2-rhamnosyltransferase
LPLIEAGRYGVPVIATDIPVFHEVGGDDVTYFDALDSNALALCLREALAGARRTPGFNVLSWRESAEALLAIVREGKYQLDAPAVREATRALNR